MNCLASSANPEPVTDKEIRNAVKSLNRGKATDAFGVTAEHIYYGGRDVINSGKFLINSVLTETVSLKHPTQMSKMIGTCL